jgi:hypothetical protein
MRVQANGKVKRSRAEWRKLLDRFEASGLSEEARARSRSGTAIGRHGIDTIPMPAGISLNLVATSTALWRILDEGNESNGIAYSSHLERWLATSSPCRTPPEAFEVRL